MKKHRTKIIAAVVIIAVLTGAWIWGGNYSRAKPGQLTIDNGQLTAEESPAAADSITMPPPAPAATSPSSPIDENPAERFEENRTNDAAGEESPLSDSELSGVREDVTKDQYLTDPVPEGKPLPVEPESVTVGDGSFTVTLSVRCGTILDNMKLLDKEKWELVPDDGVIFAAAAVTVYEGESVFNVLQREMRRAKIHMEFMNTPIYNSAYIEGINNLYEFDVGELSGWMYSVNGWYPNYGCSRYQLKPGDAVEWNYTCDLGRDLGEFWLGGQQNAG